MSQPLQSEEANKARIVLGLLESVERDGAQSQRRLATELGIALGLVNAYIKRCVKKGFLKVRHVPAGRYAYYLTPHGFAEKSRLTLEFLSSSFSFFRKAKDDCARIFEMIRGRGFSRVILAGRSDFAEIATICALESKIAIVAVVDGKHGGSHFLGIPVVKSFDKVKDSFDAIIVTDLVNAGETADSAISVLGVDRVFVPTLLKPKIDQSRDVS